MPFDRDDSDDDISPLRPASSGSQGGSSPRRSIQERTKSVKDLTALWEARGSRSSMDDNSTSVEVLRNNVVQQYYGISQVLLKHLAMLDEIGVSNFVRAKHKQALNTRHEEAAWKGSETKAKSIKRAAAELGWLTEHKQYSEGELTRTYSGETLAKVPVNERERLSEVYTRPDLDKFGSTQYLTFERQTLGYIDQMIAVGKYKVKGFGYGKDKVFFRIIEDKAGQQFMLRYEDFHASKFVTGRGSPVSASTKQFEAKVQPSDIKRRDRAKSFRETTGPQQLIRLENGTSYYTYGRLQNIIATNVDKTIRLLPYDAATKKVQEEPTINCTALGHRIKGDVDLQLSLLPTDLPINAYAYLGNKLNGSKNLTKQGLIKALEKLYSDLLTSSKDDNFHDHKKLSMYVQAAINNLNKKDNKAFTGDTVVDRLGTITLLDAAIALAINGEILHGSDAGSPLYPENILVTQIPNPKDSKSFLLAHGEFELLQIMLNRPEFENKIMSYNPCHFVVGDYRKDSYIEAKEIEVIKRANGGYEVLDADDAVGLIGDLEDIYTREDGSTFARVKIDSTVSFDGKSHPSLNKSDEQYTIKMHRLLLERNLLMLKNEYTPEKFAEYIAMLQANFAVMKGNLFTDKFPDLEATFDKGMDVVNSVINDVKNRIDVDSRLNEIEKITKKFNVAELKRSLARVDFDVNPLKASANYRNDLQTKRPLSESDTFRNRRPRS